MNAPHRSPRRLQLTRTHCSALACSACGGAEKRARPARASSTPRRSCQCRRRHQQRPPPPHRDPCSPGPFPPAPAPQAPGGSAAHRGGRRRRQVLTVGRTLVCANLNARGLGVYREDYFCYFFKKLEMFQVAYFILEIWMHTAAHHKKCLKMCCVHAHHNDDPFQWTHPSIHVEITTVYNNFPLVCS